MTHATARLAEIPVPPRRSSWPLRLVFGLLAVAIVLAAAWDALLVGRTLRALAGRAAADRGTVGAGVPVEPLQPGSPGEAAPPTAEAAVWDRHGPINLLLLGLDIDDCNQGSQLATASEARRTDTMILVHIDPATDRVSMLSLPRDLYVYIGGTAGGAHKLNTAHVFGTEVDEDGKVVPHSGPNAVKRAIEQNLDLPVHRYVRVDFQGFEKIVDVLGGIDVDVPAAPDDPTVGILDYNYPDGHCGVMTLRFPPGPQHLDGARALQYARSRYSTSDFDRSRRQMDVLLAMREQAMRLGTVLDLPKLVPAVLKTVDTDLTAEEILALARIARRVEPAAVTRLQLELNAGYADTLPIGDYEQWVIRLDSARYALLQHAFLNFMPDPFVTPDPTPAPATPAPGGGAVIEGAGGQE